MADTGCRSRGLVLRCLASSFTVIPSTTGTSRSSCGVMKRDSLPLCKVMLTRREEERCLVREYALLQYPLGAPCCRERNQSRRVSTLLQYITLPG